MALGAIFVVGGYECVRTPSNTLFKETFGRQNIPWVLALGPLAVALTLWGYNAVLTRLGPRWTMLVSCLAAGAAISFCVLGVGMGFKRLSAPFYLVREVYIVLLLEQLWSFLNSRLTRDEAAKLYGPICAVASLGAFFVGQISGTLTAAFTTWQLPLLAVAALIPTVFFFDLAFKMSGVPQPADPIQDNGRKKIPLGISEFLTHPILIVLLIVVGATQWYAAMLEVSLQHGLDLTYPDTKAQNQASMSFFGWLNAAAALLQLFAVPILMRLMPVGLIHIAIPLTNLALFLFSLANPGFMSIAAAYMFFKTVDYSLFKAAKEVLYIPLPFDARYRAKEWIDGLGYRAGKGAGGLTTHILQSLGMSGVVGTLALLGLAAWAVAVGGWLYLRKRPEPPSDSQP